jgi:flagellin
VANSGFTAGELNISNNSTTSAAGINKLTVETVEDAWLAIKQIDDSLNQVNSARATLGAVQSRFENAVSNIMIQSENTAAARGRIVDADFASETANLSKSQILQQAGTAMVAQANQLPQQVLSLLR